MSEKKVILLTEGPVATHAVLAALRDHPDIEANVQVIDRNAYAQHQSPDESDSWMSVMRSLAETHPELRVEIRNVECPDIAHLEEHMFKKKMNHVDIADKRPDFLKGAGAHITRMQRKK